MLREISSNSLLNALYPLDCLLQESVEESFFFFLSSVKGPLKVSDSSSGILSQKTQQDISFSKRNLVLLITNCDTAEIQVVEKERKAKNILLMAIPKEHMRRFQGMDDAK
ncbi:hypothetical protein Tco_1186138 [Tanacetum coccineum]